MRFSLRSLRTDPVGSKVIASLISAALLAIIAAVARLIWGARSAFWGYRVPVWLVIVLCAGVFCTSLFALSLSLRSRGRLSPKLTLLGIDAPDANPQIQDFPLKCWWIFRNDSAGAIDVTVSDYIPRNVKLKSLAMAVLQAQFHQEWLPSKHGMPRIAVLPGQLFKGWIAPDHNTFTGALVRNQTGTMGTLVLKVNGEELSFDL